MDYKDKFEKAYGHFLDYLVEVDYSTMITEKFGAVVHFFIEQDNKEWFKNSFAPVVSANNSQNPLAAKYKHEFETENGQKGYISADVALEVK